MVNENCRARSGAEVDPASSNTSGTGQPARMPFWRPQPHQITGSHRILSQPFGAICACVGARSSPIPREIQSRIYPFSNLGCLCGTLATRREGGGFSGHLPKIFSVQACKIMLSHNFLNCSEHFYKIHYTKYKYKRDNKYE